MRALPLFDCPVCGRPLDARRVRQGIGVHPGCRQPAPLPALEELSSALSMTTRTLERWHDRALAGDDETRRLFALAAAEAKRLSRDLERLRTVTAASGRSTSRLSLPEVAPKPQEKQG